MAALNTCHFTLCKAPGIDKEPTRVLKDSLLITLPFITSIIDASLLASTFPEVWKPAETTNFWTTTHRFPSYLHRQRFGRERLIISLSPVWKPKKGLPQNKAATKNGSLLRHDKKLAACLLLDMNKAFDNVDHQILLRKTQSVGASTSVLKWFNG